MKVLNHTTCPNLPSLLDITRAGKKPPLQGEREKLRRALLKQLGNHVYYSNDVFGGRQALDSGKGRPSEEQGGAA